MQTKKKDAPEGAPDPVMWLHGNTDLNATFEFEGQVVVIDRHPFDQLPDKVLIVFLNSCLLGFQKSLDSLRCR